MKKYIPIFCLLAMSASACDRVSMEQSPEALVSYGVPSQHSNHVAGPSNEEMNRYKDPSWLTSSAVNPKPRQDR